MEVLSKEELWRTGLLGLFSKKKNLEVLNPGGQSLRRRFNIKTSPNYTFYGKDKLNKISILDRSTTGKRIVFLIFHQGGNVKCATSAKLRGRGDFTIFTWNVISLKAVGKLDLLVHEMDRYKLDTL